MTDYTRKVAASWLRDLAAAALERAEFFEGKDPQNEIAEAFWPDHDHAADYQQERESPDELLKEDAKGALRSLGYDIVLVRKPKQWSNDVEEARW